jgi:hypothetical protein
MPIFTDVLKEGRPAVSAAEELAYTGGLFRIM